MSYEKQTWATGDVITAEKLNHMEDGIEDAGGGTTRVIEVVIDGSTQTLQATYNQILAWFSTGG